MKSWILKQIIAVSEITGWAVPRSMRKLAREDDLNRLKEEEARLTAALREAPDAPRELPPFLEARIEAAIAREEGPVPAVSRLTSWLTLPALSAAAALVVLAGTLFLLNPRHPESGKPEETGPPVASMERAPTSSPAVAEEPSDIDKGRVLLAEDMLVKPLANEQARLAADMTNALRYMADSFLPREYAERVSRNLNSLEEELAGSI